MSEHRYPCCEHCEDDQPHIEADTHDLPCDINGCQVMTREDMSGEVNRRRAEVERMRRWQYEACLAIEAASTISQRWATTGSGLNLGNHDRLLAEAGFSPDSAVAALDAGEP